MLLNKKRIITAVAVITAAILIAVIPLSALRRGDETFTVADSSVLENSSNRHAQPESELQTVSTLTTEGYELKLENSTLEVWYREEVCGIRVRDKASGYIWGSIAEDKVEGLNNKWCAMANALCTVEILDGKYNVSRISVSDSSVRLKEKWTSNGAKFSVDFKKQDISFDFELKLGDGYITLGLDDESIEEGDEYLLKSLYFAPFMGCTVEDTVDGYIFIPDGSGALMRFSESSNYISGYSQKVYGADLGIDQLTQVNDLVSTRTNDYLVDSAQITVPVYGVVHGANQNAVMTVISGGDNYALINATPAGVTTDYNWVTANFEYRRMYTHTVDKNSGGVYRPQQERNEINPEITMYFLSDEDASYSGMAVKYREILQSENALGKERVDKNIPLGLTVVGAEIADGSLWNYTKTLSDVNDANEFINRLSNDGVNNITMVFDGWQKGGINGSKYGTYKFQRSIGSKSDFSALSENLKNSGGNLYLAGNVVTANEDQINLQRQASQQISKQYSQFSRANSSAMYANYYVIKAGRLFDTLNKFASKLSEFNMAYGQLGYRLYADYTAKQEYTRSEFRDKVTDVLAKSNGKTALSNPNEYLWKYTDDYFDMPMNNSQYLYETDTVPFLQIVLKGSLDYYAPYANQSSYSKNDILKMIEFGAYPSFITAAADNYDLQDTPLVDYFSINFDDWYSTVVEVYGEVNSALKNVEGAYITKHTVISSGVSKVDYSNGISIYVNYNNSEVAYGDVTVGAFGYKIVGGEGK